MQLTSPVFKKINFFNIIGSLWLLKKNKKKSRLPFGNGRVFKRPLFL